MVARRGAAVGVAGRDGTVVRVLALLGASHRDVDLATLERLATDPRLEESLLALAARPESPVTGIVVLATCNRLEVYLDLDRFHDGVEAVVSAGAEHSGLPATDVAAQLRVRVDADVARHLFRVAAGLESMVVGESQISGQVSDALGRAQAEGCVSSGLHLRFQTAAHLAKQVASDTELHAAGRSVAAAAIDLAEAAAIDLAGAAFVAQEAAATAPAQQAATAEQPPVRDGGVLLIGTGAYARVVAAVLRDRGRADVAVFSPSGRQHLFAEPRGVHPAVADELPGLLRQCRLVVTCSGRGQTVLTRRLVEPALADRETPLIIVDLALKPDVPDEVRALPGVRVIDLADVAAGAAGASEDAVDAAERLVDEGVAEFERLLADRRLSPAVVALRSHVTTTIQREIDRLLPRIPAEAADEVRQAAHRITRALLHQPSVQARTVARTGDPADYLRAVHLLFGIDVPGGTHHRV
jgi:glutamyl-tRNA reductase